MIGPREYPRITIQNPDFFPKRSQSEVRINHQIVDIVEGKQLSDADILFTADPADIGNADFHIIAVPTPINDAKQVVESVQKYGRLQR